MVRHISLWLLFRCAEDTSTITSCATVCVCVWADRERGYGRAYRFVAPRTRCVMHAASTFGEVNHSSLRLFFPLLLSRTSQRDPVGTVERVHIVGQTRCRQRRGSTRRRTAMSVALATAWTSGRSLACYTPPRCRRCTHSRVNGCALSHHPNLVFCCSFLRSCFSLSTLSFWMMWRFAICNYLVLLSPFWSVDVCW